MTARRLEPLDDERATALAHLAPSWAHPLLKRPSALRFATADNQLLILGRDARGDESVADVLIIGGEPLPADAPGVAGTVESWARDHGFAQTRLRIPQGTLWTDSWLQVLRDRGWDAPKAMRTYCSSLDFPLPPWVRRAARPRSDIVPWKKLPEALLKGQPHCDRHVSHALVRDGKLVGWLHVLRRRRGMLYGWLYVEPEHRPGLTAAALLGHAFVAHQRKRPNKQAFLFVLDDRPDAWRMYERHIAPYCQTEDHWVVHRALTQPSAAIQAT